MQLSGRMELQARGRRAARGVAQPAIGRAGRGKFARWRGRGLAAPAAAGGAAAGLAGNSCLPSRLADGAGLAFCHRPAGRAHPEIGRVGRRSRSARPAIAEPDSKLSHSGRSRHHQVAGRRVVEPTAPAFRRPRDRRLGNAPDSRHRPMPVAECRLAAIGVGAGPPGAAILASRCGRPPDCRHRARRSVRGGAALGLALVCASGRAPGRPGRARFGPTARQDRIVGAAGDQGAGRGGRRRPRTRIAEPRIAAAALRHRRRDPQRSARSDPDARSTQTRLELLGRADEGVGRQCRSGAARLFLWRHCDSIRTTGGTSCAPSRRGGSSCGAAIAAPSAER